MLGAGSYRDRIIPTFQWYVPVSHRFAKLSRSANLASLLNSRHYAVFGSRFIASMTDYYNILLISPNPARVLFSTSRARSWPCLDIRMALRFGYNPRYRGKRSYDPLLCIEPNSSYSLARESWRHHETAGFTW